MFRREVIGVAECPILVRHELLSVRGWKLMLHRFQSHADDRAVHDHPWRFWTFVLRGSYDDLVPCPFECIDGLVPREGEVQIERCPHCEGGLVVGDRMRAGMLRRREANHRHRTRVGPSGCMTLVLAAPVERLWGFWRSGKWWTEHAYRARFGDAMRCEAD